MRLAYASILVSESCKCITEQFLLIDPAHFDIGLTNKVISILQIFRFKMINVSGRPTEVNIDRIKAMMARAQHWTKTIMDHARWSSTNHIKSWIESKNKMVLSGWWDYKGIEHFKLLSRDQIINSDVCCQQLMKWEGAIKELVNGKDIMFYHDVDRPHISLVTLQKLLEISCEWMWHSPYSHDLAPSDYHFYKILYMVKIWLLMMTWNRTWCIFLIRRRSSTKGEIMKRWAKGHRPKWYI